MAFLQRRGSPPLVVLAGVALLCAVFGIVAGVNPQYAILGVLGIVFVAIVFVNLPLGVAIFAALSFMDTLTTTGAAGASFDKVAGLLLFVSWLVNRATAPRTSARDILRENTPLFVSLAAYMAWTLISVLWATSHGAVLEQFYRYTLDMLLIPIVYAAVRDRRDLHTIIIGYLIGAGFSVVYGLVSPNTSSAVGGRLVGSLGEANQSATVLVAGLALSAGIWLTARRSPRVKLLTVAVAVLAVVGLVSTVSRAGLIALGTVLVCAMVVGGRWRKPAVVLTLIGVVALPVYFLALAPARITNRVTNSQSSGRNDIWEVAWRVFSAHPVLGAGADNFQDVSRDYLVQPGYMQSAGYILDANKVVHNIYLEQLVQLGVPGLIALLAVFVSVIRIGLRAAHIFERLGDAEMELLSRCWILALAAFLAADFFASELTSKQLWLVFALAPALLKLARHERAQTIG